MAARRSSPECSKILAMEREVRYCTTDDGVRIAYLAVGSGPPLVVVPLFIGSFSLLHLAPEYESQLQRIGEGRQLILYDVRGTGMSQLEVTDLSPEATIKDLEAVVRAARLKRFALWGAGIGGPRAISFAALHPRLVERLVLVGTFVSIQDVFSLEALRGWSQLAPANWELVSRMLADLGVRRVNDREGLSWASWYRQSITGATMGRYADSHANLDVGDILQRVSCPTLVVHYRNDPLYPFTGALRLAQDIPKARLITLEGPVSGLSVVGTEVIESVVEFLGEVAHSSRIPSVSAELALRTVLFTDLVGHTEMMSRLGDERGRAVLREHERITRDVLKAHVGTEVKAMGDGFMASFGSVTKAVECAVALQRAFAEREGEPLSVRVGLNAGEPIEEDGDLFGATVILASRIAAKAEGGEILVADTVRGLCSGKGFLFADRGEFVAKGFEEPVRVYEVSWRE